MATTSKSIFRTINWKEYNQSLVNRGKITLWVNDEAIKNWTPRKQKKKGRPFQYSQTAIEAALTVRYALNLPLRATEGFLTSIFALYNPALPVPDYTLLCKRGEKSPQVKRPKRVTDIVLDSTSVKVFGEGEWKVRQHGKSKKSKWRKFHIGIDPKTGEVLVHEATKSNAHDSRVGSRLLKSLKRVKNVYGDGAYDTRGFYKAVAEKQGTVIVPPRRGAALHLNEPDDSPWHARNQAVLEIRGLGGDDLTRSIWKKLRGYHLRSLVETYFSRFKRMLGGGLRSRKMNHQDAELGYKVRIMNTMTLLGMPISYAI